jgi:hypothetical protein
MLGGQMKYLARGGAVLALGALLFSGCDASFDEMFPGRAFARNFQPDAPFVRSPSYPDDYTGGTASASLPYSGGHELIVQPGQHVTITIGYMGGPISSVIIGDGYGDEGDSVEIATSDPALSSASSNVQGAITIEGMENTDLDIGDAQSANIRVTLKDGNGNQGTATSGALILCTPDGDCSLSYEHPDDGTGSSSGSSGGSDGGGGDGCATGPYSGPTGDPQSDTFCMDAWATCDPQRKQADCQIYAQVMSENPGVPACPYCP